MSTAAGWSMIVVLVAIFCGIAGVLLRTGLDGNSDEGEAPPHTVESLAYTHAAPGRGFTVPQAHRAMQQHRTCRREDCPRKRAAYQALVDARRLRPDSGRAY